MFDEQKKYSERFEFNPEYQSSAQYSTAPGFESASNSQKLYQQSLLSVHGVSNIQYEQYNTSQYEQYKYAASNAAASYAQVGSTLYTPHSTLTCSNIHATIAFD